VYITETKNAPVINATVLKQERVNMLDRISNDSVDFDSDYTVTQASYRTVGVERMDQEDHVDSYDSHEAYWLVRESLPEGHCRDIFDILSQYGEKYFEFSEKYGDNYARTNHIAAFLGITTRAVNQHKQIIQMHCLANDFIPATK
jgi:hypothetical protein